MMNEDVGGENKQEYWKAHILAARKSGKSGSAYCREHKISSVTFHSYKRRLGFTSGKRETRAFIQVERVPEVKKLPDATWLAEFLIAYQKSQ